MVAFSDSGQPVVWVETQSADLQSGLRAVSKFAGFCERTLVLDASDDEAWAAVMASYFGFGLIVEDEKGRREVMPAPTLDSAEDDSMRDGFTRRVLGMLAASD